MVFQVPGEQLAAPVHGVVRGVALGGDHRDARRERMQQARRDVDGRRQHRHQDEPGAHEDGGVPGGGPPQAVHPGGEPEPEEHVGDHGAAPEEHPGGREVPARDQDAEQRDAGGQPHHQEGAERELRSHDRAHRHRLREGERQRPLLPLFREDIEAEREDEQRQQVHGYEGEIEAAHHEVQRVLDLAVLVEGGLVRVDADIVVVGEEVALADRERGQGAGIENRGVGASGAAEDIRGARVAEGRGGLAAVREVFELLLEGARAFEVAGLGALDRRLLEAHPGHPVRQRIHEEEREDRERERERPVGGEQAPLVLQDRSEDHDQTTSARRTPAATKTTAAPSQSPSTRSDTIRLFSTQPSVGAS